MQYVNREVFCRTTCTRKCTEVCPSPPSVCLFVSLSVRLSICLYLFPSVCKLSPEDPAVYHTSCLSRIPEEIKKRRQGKTSSFEQKPATKEICGGDGERGSCSISTFCQKIRVSDLYLFDKDPDLDPAF
jgi:hypothetical protein